MTRPAWPLLIMMKVKLEGASQTTPKQSGHFAIIKQKYQFRDIFT